MRRRISRLEEQEEYRARFFFERDLFERTIFWGGNQIMRVPL